jgi:hypothetical protein
VYGVVVAIAVWGGSGRSDRGDCSGSINESEEPNKTNGKFRTDKAAVDMAMNQRGEGDGSQ